MRIYAIGEDAKIVHSQSVLIHPTKNIVILDITEACNFNKEDLFSAIDIKIEREKKRLERIEEMNELYGVGY